MNQSLHNRIINKFHKSAEISHSGNNSVNDLTRSVLAQRSRRGPVGHFPLGNYQFAGLRTKINNLDHQFLTD